MDVKQFFSRMAKADIADALGVAVNDAQVSVAHVRKRINKVHVVDFWFRTIDAPREGRWPLIADFVRECAGETVPEGARLSVVVDRKCALLAHMQLPAAAMENLDRVVAYETDRIFPLPTDSIYTDQFARSVGTIGERITVTVIAAPKQVVEELQTELRAAGFAPRAVTSLPVALTDYYHFCRGDQSGAAGIFYRDDGRESMTVVNDGQLISSAHFDPALESRSDRLGRALETVLPDRAEGIVEMIIDEENEVGDVTLASLAPPNFLPPGKQPSWREAAAIGAALGQLNEARFRVNLLPSELVRADEGIGLREIFLSGLVVLMAATLAVTIAVKNIANSRALGAEVARLLPEVSEVTREEEQDRLFLNKIEVLEGGRSQSVLAYLRDMTVRLPDTAYLTTFRFKGDRLEVDGIADSAAGLISVLEKSPYFSNVQFTAPTTKYLQDQERFSLRMELEQ